jgi:hypothetical protein
MIEGEQIVNTGGPPWQVGITKATVRLMNTNLSKATALDPNGYAAGAVAVKKDGGTVTIELPANAMYVILQ